MLGEMCADFEGVLHVDNLRMRLNYKMSKIIENQREAENEINGARNFK